MEVAVDRINVSEQTTNCPVRSSFDQNHFHSVHHFQAHQQLLKKEQNNSTYTTTPSASFSSASHIITDGQQSQENTYKNLNIHPHLMQQEARNSIAHSHHQVSHNTGIQHDSSSSASGGAGAHNSRNGGLETISNTTRNYGLAIRLTTAAGKNNNTASANHTHNNKVSAIQQKISRFSQPTVIDESRVSLPVYHRKQQNNNNYHFSDSLPDNTSSSSYSSDNMKNEYLCSKFIKKEEFTGLYKTFLLH